MGDEAEAEEAPTTLKAHLAVTSQLELEESTYQDDGSSSSVNHYGQDDQSPLQAGSSGAEGDDEDW